MTIFLHRLAGMVAFKPLVYALALLAAQSVFSATLEAELPDGTPGATTQEIADAGASGGKYIRFPDKNSTITWTLPSAGTYDLRFSHKGVISGGAAFTVTPSGGTAVNGNFASSASWIYSNVVTVTVDATATVELNSGKKNNDLDIDFMEYTAVGGNNPPVANDDGYSVERDNPLSVSAPGVLGNDTDPESDYPLTAELVTDVPAGHSLTLNSDGSFTYTPLGGFTGDVTFTYNCRDTNNNLSAAPATVTITVTPPNAGTLEFSSATYNVVENVSTATITVKRVGGTAGAISVDYATSNGTATAGSDYTAIPATTLNWAGGDGTDKTFTVTILDDIIFEGNETVILTLSNATGGASITGTNPATLTIIEDESNDPGTVEFSSATYNVAENGTTATITVRRVGGANGAISVDYATSNGTATAGSDYTTANNTLNWANGDSSDKTFPVTILDDAIFEGNETVILTLSGATGGASITGTNPATLTIIENDANTPPTAVADSYATDEDVAINEPAPGVRGNDSDPDGQPFTAHLVSYVSNGVLSFNADGSFVYTPNFNWNGTDSFQYRLHDGMAYGAPATVTITVNPINDGPTAVGDLYTTDRDVQLDVVAPGYLANDWDAESDSFTPSLVSTTSYGVLAFNTDGSFSYIPNTGYSGVDSFTYVCNDGTDGNVATVRIRIVNAHNAYGCGHCHAYHGAGGSAFVARGDAQKLLCESCHNPSGDASAKLSFGTLDHGGSAVQVECGRCHNVHADSYSTDSHNGNTTDLNLHQIRSDFSRQYTNGRTDAVFQVRTETAFTTTPYNGLCQGCHQQGGAANYGWTNGNDITGPSSHLVEKGTDCLGCHSHMTDFKPPEGQSTCTDCHGGPAGTTRREVVSEFGYTSHHGANPIDVADCEVCHDQTGHQTPPLQVKLFNLGGGPNIVLAENSDPDTNATEAAKLEPFCLGCHDDDGPPGGAPFSDGLTPQNLNVTNWNSGYHKTAGMTCYGPNGCHTNGHGSQKANMLGPNPETAATSPGFEEQEEGQCFNCHKTGGVAAATPVYDLYDFTHDPDPGGNDSYPGVHWGVKSSNLNDRHDIQYAVQSDSRSGAKIECSDCHDVHGPLVNGQYPLKADPDSTSGDGHVPGSGYFTGASYMSDWCLDCHDGSFPATITSPGAPRTNMLDAWTNSDGHGVPVGTMSIGLNPLSGWTAGATLQCLDCHVAHMESKRNLFHLRDAPSNASRTGTVMSSITNDYNYYYYENRRNIKSGIDAYNYERGHNWCYTCHVLDGGTMETKGDCVGGGHAHGSSKF